MYMRAQRCGSRECLHIYRKQMWEPSKFCQATYHAMKISTKWTEQKETQESINSMREMKTKENLKGE